jgi:inorganic pyrophosphatase
MEETDVIVEIPTGCNLKYEITKTKPEKLRLDRILSSSMAYPGNYGFIENTLAEDGDPLDALVISPYAMFPGCIVSCRVIGALEMTDEKGLDEKLILVPSSSVDPHYDDITDITDLSKATKKKILHFFTHYKSTEVDKWVNVSGFINKKKSLDLLDKYRKAYAN